MAQYDVYIQQNTASSGIEWQEKSFTPTANSLFGFASDSYAKKVTMATAGGLALSSDTLKIDFANMTAETTIDNADLVMIFDNSASAIRKITRANLVAGIADSFKAKIAANGTEDYLGADATTGILRTTSPITYVADGTNNFITLSVQDATAAQKGVVQVGTNIDVASGTISVATATTSAKGVASFASGDFSVAAGAVSLAADVIRRVAAPALWNSSGTQYQFAVDSNFLYVAVATNSWRRTGMAKF